MALVGVLLFLLGAAYATEDSKWTQFAADFSTQITAVSPNTATRGIASGPVTVTGPAANNTFIALGPNVTNGCLSQRYATSQLIAGVASGTLTWNGTTAFQPSLSGSYVICWSSDQTTWTAQNVAFTVQDQPVATNTVANVTCANARTTANGPSIETGVSGVCTLVGVANGSFASFALSASGCGSELQCTTGTTDCPVTMTSFGGSSLSRGTIPGVNFLTAGTYSVCYRPPGAATATQQALSVVVSQAGTNVNCVGTWTCSSGCSASCGGGTQQCVFNVTQQQVGGGLPCNYTAGSNMTQACNTQTCPTPVFTSTIRLDGVTLDSFSATAFQQQVATAAGVQTNQVNILRTRSGSVFVDWQYSGLGSAAELAAVNQFQANCKQVVNAVCSTYTVTQQSTTGGTTTTSVFIGSGSSVFRLGSMVMAILLPVLLFVW